MRRPPTEPHPLLFGSDEIVDGYYDLEEIERNVAMDCLTRHPREVKLWYRALTLYCRAMTQKWDFSNSNSTESNEIVEARSLRVHLLGVNLGLAKSCLDNLLAGYYSTTFATIRHMIETSMHIVYFALYPGEASGHWRTADTIRSKVKKRSKKIDPKLATIAEQLYTQWVKVGIGAHPSVEGLRASESDDNRYRIFGANYVEEMFLFGIDQGLYALSSLLNWFRVAGIPSDDWLASLDEWMHDVDRWRVETIAPYVNDRGGWISVD